MAADWQNPFVLRDVSGDDPTGLAPNQEDAMNLEEVTRYIEELEEMSATEVNKNMLWNYTSRTKIAAERDAWNNLKIQCNRPFKYIYTRKAGWIDLGHFVEAAWGAAKTWRWLTERVGEANELWQYITGCCTGNYSAGASAYTYEDYPSNHHGAVFGSTADWKSGKKLSQMIREYLKKLEPMEPEAGNFYELARTEEAWVQEWLRGRRQDYMWRDKQYQREHGIPKEQVANSYNATPPPLKRGDPPKPRPIDRDLVPKQ